MTGPSRNEAADALRDIEQTQRKSYSVFGYKSAAPFLILWGVLWIVGYGTTDLSPRYAGDAWLAVTVVGLVASTLLGMRAGTPQRRPFSWRIFFSWITAIIFFCAIIAVLRPSEGAQIGAVIPLLVACGYVILGIWIGARLVIAGIAIAALTLIGFYFLPQHFGLWMAVIGGATLIGTGLWLRTV